MTIKSIMEPTENGFTWYPSRAPGLDCMAMWASDGQDTIKGITRIIYTLSETRVINDKTGQELVISNP